MMSAWADPLGVEAESPSILAELVGIGVRYGSQWVLRNINLTLRSGDRIALIGPNGAGKTTLLKALLGMVPAAEGQIRWAHPKPRIGYVPQRLQFDPHFPISVEEFLAVSAPGPARWFGGVPRSKSRAIASVLERVEAVDLVGKKLGTLSGGELQRILIAAALLQQPQLMILDEPASNIDQRGSQALQALLWDLHKEYGLTLVFVSHDLHWVGRLADRVACLDTTLCGLGSPDEVLSDHYLEKTYGDSFMPKLGGLAGERNPL